MNSQLNNLDAAGPATDSADQPTVIPVFEEELSIAKRMVETARVRVTRVTHNHERVVDELLQHETVEVERVTIDREVEAMPSVREEGDVTIIPVVEEILKVERRLLLKEEVHIRRTKRTESFQQVVTLRRQEAQVSRMPLNEPERSGDGAQSNAIEPGKENL